jgi:predicted amidohydrolase
VALASISSLAVACLDRDGSLAGVYRKTRLFGAEPEVFEAGRTPVASRAPGR